MIFFFFPHKGKSNISFGTVKGLLLFVCIHNIGKLSAGFEQEGFNDEPKLGNSKLAQRYDKYIYRKL